MASPRKRKDRKGWWVTYRDREGRRRHALGGKTRREAQLKKNRLESLSISPSYLAGHSDKDAALESYRRHLNTKAGKDHIDQTLANIGKIMDSCKFKDLNDVRVQPVESFLQGVLEVGLSIRTRNRYRTSMMAIMAWAAARGIIDSNPLTIIPHLNEDRDRRRVSRSMTVEEFWRLIDATKDAKWGGEKRSLYYLLAGRLGLRWREIRRLRPKHFDLTGQPVIKLDASITKNGRDAVLALGPGIVERLNLMELTDPVFEGNVDIRTWKHDLARAGLIGGPETNWEGYHSPQGTLHRKCLRVAYCTHMYEGGVDLMDAVLRMRHSDPKITMKHYARIRVDRQLGAVEALERHHEGP